MPQKNGYRPTPTSPTAHPESQPADSTAAQNADDFLDEVDSVLEENALEVVRRFVNRGGQ